MYVVGSRRPPAGSRDTASPVLRCHGPPAPSREIGRVIVTALTPAGRHAPGGTPKGCSPEPMQVAVPPTTSPGRLGGGLLIPPRALGPAALPHTRDRVAPARRIGGELRSSRRFATRTLALGTCRDRRSRVSPARSLFSSQGTACVVHTPDQLHLEPVRYAVPVLQVLHSGPSSTSTDPLGFRAGTSWRTLRIAPGQGSWLPRT
jgi:hypothetical protein